MHTVCVDVCSSHLLPTEINRIIWLPTKRNNASNDHFYSTFISLFSIIIENNVFKLRIYKALRLRGALYSCARMRFSLLVYLESSKFTTSRRSGR